MNDRQQKYEQLVAPIEDRMIRAVWRITRDRGDAEDAFQEALLTIWKRWDRICAHPNPQALMLHICVNAAHDALRRRARQGRWLNEGALPESVTDPSAPPDERVQRAEQQAGLFHAIGRLSQNQGRAILLHAVEEMPYSDIAAAMGCREVTVRKHIARARTRLRALLSHLMPVVRMEERADV